MPARDPPPPPGKKPSTLAGQLAKGRRPTGELNPVKPSKLTEKSKAVAEARASHRQQVWDKLDSAKKAAEEKKKRLTGFAPKAAAEAEPGADDDFEL